MVNNGRFVCIRRVKSFMGGGPNLKKMFLILVFSLKEKYGPWMVHVLHNSFFVKFHLFISLKCNLPVSSFKTIFGI